MAEDRTSILEAFACRTPLLTEGAIIERVRRELHPSWLRDDVAHCHLVQRVPGASALARLYGEYVEVGRAAGLSTLLFTPTWRASAERVCASGLGTVEELNRAAIGFLERIRDGTGVFAARLYLGGLVGPRGDAYRGDDVPASIVEACDYHRPQVQCLARGGVDILLGATIPSLRESLGMARAMAETDAPYALSFIVTREGRLLDGTPLGKAIEELDACTARPAVGFLCNCVHPDVLHEALGGAAGTASTTGWLSRVIGLQGNTSKLEPSELDGAARLKSEDPDRFADAMKRVADDYGLHVLGGCCGTDARHIRALAIRMIQRRI